MLNPLIILPFALQKMMLAMLVAAAAAVTSAAAASIFSFGREDFAASRALLQRSNNNLCFMHTQYTFLDCSFCHTSSYRAKQLPFLMLHYTHQDGEL